MNVINRLNVAIELHDLRRHLLVFVLGLLAVSVMVAAAIGADTTGHIGPLTFPSAGPPTTVPPQTSPFQQQPPPAPVTTPPPNAILSAAPTLAASTGNPPTGSTAVGHATPAVHHTSAPRPSLPVQVSTPVSVASVGTPQPAAQLNVGANLGVTQVALGVGLGPNSCIGLSLGNSPSCATGSHGAPLSLSLGTPLLTLSL
jgi:hypothetical protein